METAKAIARKLRGIVVADKVQVTVLKHTDDVRFDITSVDSEVTVDNPACATFEVQHDGETLRGVPCRRRWRVQVTEVEGSTADDEFVAETVVG